uniref:Uncharacterized protein n=1 Tax=Aplanochytrium stocchinoi TaxID=215587 RepID=A0A6S8EMY3_9STRA|mmetsp:Transcript_1248/g.1599  ORF Transcript_1248/g.1599 Transcript_1248/m.1599 type:complete len:334 (-) Transcript_1248:1562-2563(-)|eukprot:CAMPEP_0204823250 /NCGR_PEP_ID=MMETSP1346-20131115/1324_1 /ASSEMBLY_ACC=CAM_ASM_000771 /TAXON_ID=215587 /ORGANISM="Aplanochytrium stocchinoi, Strain GSBS06" /LENGTH=333 /DNA_ID=CAMNT_0051949817 /DNA_START=345 /DNA_END=1346 /DNA_ORIENTATION=+
MFTLKRGCGRNGPVKTLCQFLNGKHKIDRFNVTISSPQSGSLLLSRPQYNFFIFPVLQQKLLHSLQLEHHRKFTNDTKQSTTGITSSSEGKASERPEWYYHLTEEEQADYNEHMRKWDYFFAGRSDEEKTQIQDLFNNDDPDWEKNYLEELEEEIEKMTQERRAELDSIFVKTEEEKMRTMHQVIDWMADKKMLMEEEPPEEIVPVLEMVDKLPITLEYKGDIDGQPSPAVPYPRVKLTVDLMSLGLSNRETDCFVDIVGPRLENRQKKTRTNPNPSKRENPYVKFTCDKYDNFHQNTWGVKKLLYDCIIKAKEIEKATRTSSEIIIDDLEKL